MLKLYFETEGFQVVEGCDGYDALDKAVKHVPDLIIMDMAMPFMDGINSTQAIRQQEVVSGIPILCITGHGELYEPRARDAGCIDGLHKPVNFSQLKPLVEQYLSGR